MVVTVHGYLAWLENGKRSAYPPVGTESKLCYDLYRADLAGHVWYF